MTRRAVSTMCVLLLALTLAACGSSKKSSSSSSSGTKSEATTTTAGESASGDSTADKAKGEAINLKAEDFPAGWTSKPASTDTNDATDKELYTCSGLPDPATNTTATVSSPDFSQGTFTSASSEVRFAKSNDVAKKVLEAFKNDKFQTCLKQTFDKEMTTQASGAGGTVGQSKIESLPAPSGADGAAFRMTVPISASGFNLNFYIDFTVLQKGRAVVTLAAFNGNSPFDSALKGELTAKLVSRMASNA